MSAYSICRNLRSVWLGVFVAAALMPTLLKAADHAAKKAPPPDAKEVELFKAMDDGDVDVRVVMKDSKEGVLKIQNKTDQPLNVKLPEAFGTVPILAQQNNNVNRNNNAAQANGAGNNNMMNAGYIAPEKVAQIPFPAVCLEHGKPEPRASIPYTIKPIEQVTDKPEVIEVCRMLGKGQINQRAAQVAAWHLNNNMSWQQLAAKRVKHANGTSEPYFSPLEIKAGMQVVAMAAKLVQEKKPASSGD
jgi:hypothetical protein